MPCCLITCLFTCDITIWRPWSRACSVAGLSLTGPALRRARLWLKFGDMKEHKMMPDSSQAQGCLKSALSKTHLAHVPVWAQSPATATDHNNDTAVYYNTSSCTCCDKMASRRLAGIEIGGPGEKKRHVVKMWSCLVIRYSSRPKFSIIYCILKESLICQVVDLIDLRKGIAYRKVRPKVRQSRPIVKVLKHT